jgi:hypothetical protein
MISFNENDFFLKDIKLESKLYSLVTNKNYRIYGLKEGGPISINLEFNYKKVDRTKQDLLKLFLDNNKISTKLVDTQYIEEGSKYLKKNNIYIGLIKNLRKNVLFSSCLLQTLVYFFEGRLTLDPKYPIKNNPFSLDKKSV